MSDRSTERENYMTRALCRNSELPLAAWDEDDHKMSQYAVDLCNVCPVKEICAETAMEQEPYLEWRWDSLYDISDYGIRGGMSAFERLVSGSGDLLHKRFSPRPCKAVGCERVGWRTGIGKCLAHRDFFNIEWFVDWEATTLREGMQSMRDWIEEGGELA